MNSIDSMGSVELIPMNLIALHIKCIMQLMESSCRVDEDTSQLICSVPYAFSMLYSKSNHSQFSQFSVKVSKLKSNVVYIFRIFMSQPTLKLFTKKLFLKNIKKKLKLKKTQSVLSLIIKIS